jgi:hypothetical protein
VQGNGGPWLTHYFTCFVAAWDQIKSRYGADANPSSLHPKEAKMPTRTKHNWNLDSQGQYPRQVGWSRSRNGNLVQHKFRLGNDLKEAKRREQKLLDLWNRMEEILSERPLVWTPNTLDWAKQIAKGACQIRIPKKPDWSNAEYAAFLHRMQRHYPMISFLADDEAAYVSGMETNRSVVNGQIEKLQEQIEAKTAIHVQNGNISEADLSRGGVLLHDAMRAYIAWIEKDYYRPALGRINDGGRTKIRQVETLIDRHENVPLSTLDETRVEEMFRYWRQRPFKKDSTTPISKKSAENYIGELKRFFRWLHKSKDFDWQKPENFDEIKTKVDPAPTDKQKKLVQVATFSLEELRLLNEHATALERAFLLLGLNCGFGMAEIASLLVGEVALFRGHDQRHQEILHYPTTDADSFIKRIRRKNGVYGEHILFPQTVEALQWALDRRKQHPGFNDNAILFLNDKGLPYNQPTKGNHRNQQIPNRFWQLTKRIKEQHPEFSDLSFGKLRKTAGDLIRRFAGGEIHAVFMCHGQPVATDNLTDVYSNRPFGRVFEAIRRVQEYLKPVFDAAGQTPFSKSRLSQTAYGSAKTRDRILDLRDKGKSIREIAAELGKTRMTVQRYLRRHRPRPR